MPSRYEILATVLDQANITDEYGHIDTLKIILEACHALDHPKFDAPMLADSIFSIIAVGWLTVQWDHEEGECWKKTAPDPAPVEKPEHEPVDIAPLKDALAILEEARLKYDEHDSAAG